ncbi:MAG: GAF domain-containing protein, partial [Clostridiales Family XIII bacterium]|nr:GAF domain-containing protein [Clostridiales Family XIII bacterium]
MSIRARITLVMALTAILVIVFGIGTGFIFTQGNMEKTIEKDMTAVAEIADALITTKINLLKSDAETVAVSLGGAADSKYHGILEGQLGKYADFMAFTVFSPGGVVATAGDPVTPPGLIDSEYIKRAFAGEMVISTTRFDPSGTLVFHVCVPAEKGYVLSATVSGMFFSEFVSDFTIWNTGNIFVIDETGTIIANVRDYMTLERYNFIELAKTDPVHESIGSFMENMIQEDRGIGRYTFGGVERICAYVTITGSNAGWSLGVAAPLPESPIRDVQSGFILVGFICFAISVMLAFFTSGPISKPYNELHEVMTALKDMDGLLRTTNDAATLLLGSGVGEFEKIMDQGMDMIAQSAGASRVRIWKNSGGGGNPSYESLYTWMDEKTSQQGLAHVPFAEKFPDWLARLQDKESINVSVTALPEEEQAAFTPHGILSLMLMPVFRQDQFWGFFSFEDCYDERPFSDDEESVLRSGCMLLANAMNRHETTLALIEAREEALSSAETKGNFLANMSHEMRTPLNAIIGLSELSLNLNEVQGETRINLEKVYNSGMT